jgi:hypothetical protein
MKQPAVAGAQIGRGGFQFAYFRFQSFQGRGVAAALGFVAQLIQFQELVVDVDQMLCHHTRPFSLC